MKQPQHLLIRLLSDSHFGMGAGTAGLVDREIDHDEYGMPIINGKSIHGLLKDSWLTMHKHFPELISAAKRILGEPKLHQDSAILHISNATLPLEISKIIKTAILRKDHPLTPDMILDVFTDIRIQTSQNRENGAPAKETLHSIRVLTRGIILRSELNWLVIPNSDDIKVLSLMLLGTRHAGLERNRGLGLVELSLDGNLDETIRATEVSNAN